VLDESLARPVRHRQFDWLIAQAILNLPSTVGVTAYLNLQYKAPTMAECVRTARRR